MSNYNRSLVVPQRGPLIFIVLPAVFRSFEFAKFLNSFADLFVDPFVMDFPGEWFALSMWRNYEAAGRRNIVYLEYSPTTDTVGTYSRYKTYFIDVGKTRMI